MHHRYRYPRGRVHAKGFFYSSDEPLEPFKHLVFQLWSSGCKMYRVELGFVILLEGEVACFIDSQICTPLIKHAGMISNVLWFDLEDSLSSLNSNSLWLLYRGNLSIETLDSDTGFDPSVWLDLDAYRDVGLKSLGELYKPRLIRSDTGVSVRDVLKDSELKESPELRAVISKLDEIKKNGSVSARDKGRSVFGFFSFLKNVFSAGNGGSGAPSRESRRRDGSAAGGGGRQGRHQKVGLLSRIRIAFSQMVLASSLGKMIGEAQARHVQKLMQKLGAGDLDEALRNAVPLGNLKDALNAGSLNLGAPGRRDSLIINPKARGPSQAVSLEETLLNRLRSMYEAAYVQVDKAGDYKKAAFILAELLRDIDRAVSYLEKHGQYRLAAELAEGQELPPPRVIRQWVLADDVERAMQVAIVSGCFEEAITALERSHVKEANSLRWHIAQLNYKAGNTQAAIDIAWPLENRRDQVVRWLKESFQLGGDIGARHLVRLAVHDVSNQDIYLRKICQVLNDGAGTGSLAVYKEIIKFGEDLANTYVSSIAPRAYLRAVAGRAISHDPKIWGSLCKLAGDLTLRADARRLTFGPEANIKPLKDLNTAKESVFDGSHGRRALDCAVLQSGEVLLAFGESGVELWSSKGRRLHSYSVPCHSIVINDIGTQALLIADRSGYQVVSKFFGKTRDVQHWLELNLCCWANSYDGTRWLVAQSDAVMMIDTNSDENTALWMVGDLGGAILGFERSSSHFSFCLESAGLFELWSYRLPNLYLKERTPYKNESLAAVQPAAFGANGLLAGLNANSPDQFCLYQGAPSGSWTTLGFAGAIESLRLAEKWLIVVTRDDDSVSVHLYPVSQGKLKRRVKSLQICSSGDLNIRVHGEKLLVNHSDGRVLILDLEFGSIKSDFVA